MCMGEPNFIKIYSKKGFYFVHERIEWDESKQLLAKFNFYTSHYSREIKERDPASRKPQLENKIISR